MAQDEKHLSLDTPLNSLAPGDYRIELKAKNAALTWLLKFIANNGGTWDFWGKVIIPALEEQNPHIKMPRSNFVAGKFRPRKGWDEKDKTFWFWIKVVK
ncbi:hypothetical protein [Deinococcus roseus]|uniref:Uncharacterized protein n=1 Tax=Deinococcus roseus TaxID=392414 RepID=A0ABQ2DG35_9DEIO|nr:hypothetical protein [Deinococcus roseus]GGJ56504.1 hypothetical protein GCM10008938_48330 [Deinococcus roseus]